MSDAAAGRSSEGEQQRAVVMDVVALVVSAIVIALAVAVDADALTPSRAVVLGAIGVSAVVVLGFIWPHLVERFGDTLKSWMKTVVDSHIKANATSSAATRCQDDSEVEAPVPDEAVYWFLPIAVISMLIGLALAGLAVVALADLSWGEVWPWLLVALAVLFALLSLVAMSYAPPGPNWVERISGVDGSAILIMIGIVVVVLGTLQYFEFGEDGSAPTDWWLAVVGGGLLLGLMGINRPPRDDPSERRAGRDEVVPPDPGGFP